MLYNYFVIEIKAKKLSGLAKAKGLINSENPYPIFFKTRFGIHTFGLNFPIDVLILNNENKVIKIAKNLKPNRILFWNFRFNIVVELPEDMTRKMNIKLGNKIKFRFT